MCTSKIRIKLGDIEVDYEVSEEFLKAELPEILGAVAKLHRESGGSAGGGARTAAGANGGGGGGGHTHAKTETMTGTTATIAAKLGGDSGSDLIIAGAAQLTFVEGKDEFTTVELRAACRAAKNLWKKSYQNNFTNYVGMLVADKAMNEVRTGVYALDAKKRHALESKLAEG